MKLSHEPSVEITVTVTGQDQTDLELTGLGEGNTLTFDATSWSVAQTVTVKADRTTRRSPWYTPAREASTRECPPIWHRGRRRDRLHRAERDHATVVEGDAAGQTYTVKLSHEPSVEVTVTVTGQDTTDLDLTGLGEGDTLTFTTSTWDDAQTVTVKAERTTDAKNDSVTLVHTAAGGEYAGAKSDVAVTVDDDETVSVVLSKSSLTVVEGDTAGRPTRSSDTAGQ